MQLGLKKKMKYIFNFFFLQRDEELSQYAQDLIIYTLISNFLSKLDETLKNAKKIDKTLLDIQLEILFSEFRDFIYPEIIPSAESIFNYLSSLFLVFKDSISRDEFFELRNIKSPPTPDYYKSKSNKKDLRLEVNLLHEKVKKTDN